MIMSEDIVLHVRVEYGLDFWGGDVAQDGVQEGDADGGKFALSPIPSFRNAATASRKPSGRQPA
jgi:hypothetical protein